MLTSGHESVGWSCPLCCPDWRPGPDDPPVAEMMRARNCRHDPAGGMHLDLPYAPEATVCPRRYVQQAAPMIDAWRSWRTFGRTPKRQRVQEAIQALEDGAKRGEAYAKTQERQASIDRSSRASLEP